MADRNTTHLDDNGRLREDAELIKSLEKRLKSTRIGNKPIAQKRKEQEQKVARIELAGARDTIAFAGQFSKFAEKLGLDLVPLDNDGWLGALIALKEDAADPAKRARFNQLGAEYKAAQRGNADIKKCLVTAKTVSEEMKAAAKDIKLRFSVLADGFEGRAKVDAIIAFATEFGGTAALVHEGEKVEIVSNGSVDEDALELLTISSNAPAEEPDDAAEENSVLEAGAEAGEAAAILAERNNATDSTMPIDRDTAANAGREIQKPSGFRRPLPAAAKS